ncbi:transcription antitermination factor NusB [Paenisporosarcina cavernae]|uniref:Transcription antitermination protein NusB n=1 Tax=Paenisporosarcina cavernae TaxID=2320858 RepID=A0A385YVF0_9BACL|nr:transcription antitermination factor NusB [Paenisporosarcina cavernae]AYC29542.1 transcription antitermination factor NusB [Paenisporosarcina cavernae]
MKRREAREKAIQTLFQLDNSELQVDEAISHVMGEESDSFYEKLVRGTVSHVIEIDEKLRANLENWSLDRLPKIERTVLRLAVYELSYNEDAPARVVMNEAIELSKLFGDEQSSKFVNGVLSKFIPKSSQGE